MNVPQSPTTQKGGTATVDSVTKLRLLGPRVAMSTASRWPITITLEGSLRDESDETLLTELGESSGLGLVRVKAWVVFVRPVAEPAALPESKPAKVAEVPPPPAKTTPPLSAPAVIQANPEPPAPEAPKTTAPESPKPPVVDTKPATTVQSNLLDTLTGK